MLVRALLTFLTLTILIRTSQASENQAYVSITALNKYGQSEQLRNAREGAMRHGMPVVAATAREGIVVVSIITPKSGVVLNPRIIHKLSMRSESMGIVCSGVRGDVNWLVQTVRAYQKHNWKSYDLKSLSTKRCERAIAHALLTFMGYDRENELHDQLIVSSDESFSRPLGILTLLISLKNPITLIEASGISQQFHAYAIGKYSKEINDKLEIRYQVDQSIEDVQMLLTEIIREVKEQLRDDGLIVVELLTEKGITRVQGI
mmetsp:Transcript_11523/g.16903  ORF Transcript_11523/g.16903 Transcript_11523/m.16903 type:complete len:261 (+) Transcript_11523:271-1053(+)|eukprot:CAMPEP_0194207344 /NCGR_PEP_ID=MMETSP0156-20130528/6113_1 /TAXON_ID=33649 /ORGANISM="Thalassionema nitzschioides, Strain L26-B" /LENGTH=260 /DNA_ID=CAMNT_0038934083 /DNA_START=192 /DNA_END=974 /DNA_ORIENTATION=+